MTRACEDKEKGRREKRWEEVGVGVGVGGKQGRIEKRMTASTVRINRPAKPDCMMQVEESMKRHL